ncbi:hypothetical protein ACHAWF_017001 [Thalassiosira exigua]
MKVLCLHPASSSAARFATDLAPLAERLASRHGIELVVVDAPLVDVVAVVPPGDVAGHVEAPSRRRWYVEEEGARAAPIEGGEEPAPSSSSIRCSGLDASLLHLSQVWARSGAHNDGCQDAGLPFQGVLGVGQGADVAGLLPLLARRYAAEDDDDDEFEGAEGPTPTPMFEGLEFAILVDGRDLLGDRDGGEGGEGGEEELYVGPDGPSSLHVVLEGDGDPASDDGDDLRRGRRRRRRSEGGERLAKKYGPRAELRRLPRPSSSSDDDPPPSSWSPALSNLVGRRLVSLRNDERRRLSSASTSRDPLARALATTRARLAAVEREAAATLAEEVRRNPPRALLAAIEPGGAGTRTTNDAIRGDGDGNREAAESPAEGGAKGDDASLSRPGRTVGAWRGPRRRGFGEEGGGAPCPEEFLRREGGRGR